MQNKFISIPRTEKSLIGAILRDNDLFALAHDAGATAATFTDTRNARIFDAISAHLNKGEVADLVAIGNDLPDLVEYAAELTADTITGVNAPDWIENLRQCEARRAMKYTAEQCVAKLAAGEITIDDFADKISDCQKKVRIDTNQLKPLDTIAKEFEAEFLQPQAPATIPVFPPNTKVGQALLFRPGQILTIAAGSGIGKTQLATQAAIEQLKAGLSVLYICTETTGREIFARLLASIVGRNHYALMYEGRGNQIVQQFAAAKETVLKMFKNRLRVQGVDDGSLNISRFKNLMREAARTMGKVDVVVIDYIQDLEPLDLRATANDNLCKAMTIISHTAKEHHAAAVVLSQINRTGQNAEGTPSLSWLKDCSKIGELSNTVCFLLPVNRDNGKDEAQLHCVKSRDCRRFSAILAYENAKYISEPCNDPRCAPDMQHESGR